MRIVFIGTVDMSHAILTGLMAQPEAEIVVGDQARHVYKLQQEKQHKDRPRIAEQELF